MTMPHPASNTLTKLRESGNYTRSKRNGNNNKNNMIDPRTDEIRTDPTVSQGDGQQLELTW
jgi:hypothetical protein